MATLALTLYAVWLLLAFGLRSLVQLRTTGDTGLRIDQGSRGSVQWWSRRLFVAAIATGLAAPLLDLAGLAQAIAALDRPALTMTGVALATVGIVATVAAQTAMGTAWRIGVDENERAQLVTHGIFQLVRNPIFTAMIVTAAGLALLVPNIVALIGWMALLAAIELQVRLVEEPYLQSTHGGAYETHRASVGRFVPASVAHRAGSADLRGRPGHPDTPAYLDLEARGPELLAPSRRCNQQRDPFEELDHGVGPQKDIEPGLTTAAGGQLVTVHGASLPSSHATCATRGAGPVPAVRGHRSVRGGNGRGGLQLP